MRPRPDALMVDGDQWPPAPPLTMYGVLFAEQVFGWKLGSFKVVGASFLPIQKAVAVAAHVGGRVSAHVTLEVTEAFPATMRQMPTTLSGQRWS